MSIFASFDETPSAALRSCKQACCVTIKSASELTAKDHARWASLWARSGHGDIFAADWFMASALPRCAESRARCALQQCVRAAGSGWGPYRWWLKARCGALALSGDAQLALRLAT